MQNYINIVFDKIEEVDEIVVEEVTGSATVALLEDETSYDLYDTEEGQTVLTVQTHKQLGESESDDVANDIANKLFDLGYDNFDIEVSV